MEGEPIWFDTLIQIGDTCYEWPGSSHEDGSNYAALINQAGELAGPDRRVFSILIPYSASVMLTREYRETELNCAIEEDVLTDLEGMMDGPNVYPVRIIDTLIAHNNEYLYFRSDHHWTALGAYYGYLEWAKAAHVEPVTLDAYTPMEQGEYLGLYYDLASDTQLLWDNPDSVTSYYPPGDLHLYITDDPVDSPEWLGEESPVLFDETEAPIWYKYGTFLAGDHAFCALVNDSIPDDSACLVYKNSMGNCFVYYLTQHYHSVYVADYRYYETRNLADALEVYGIDDVLFVNNTTQAEWYGGVEYVASAIG